MNWERFEPVLRLLDDHPFHRLRRSRLAWWAIGIIGLTTLTYVHAVLVNGFFWEDHSTLNGVASLFSLKHVWVRASGAYRPLALTLLWAERRGFEEVPAAYHWVGLLIHATNCVLLWLILRRLQVRGAWLAAALFALHPVQVQSVAWITQQPVLVGSVFYLLAVWAYLRWSRINPPSRMEASGMEPNRPKSRVGLAIAVVAATAATLCGPMACSLPLVLLLLVWWKRGSVQRSDWKSLAPFFVLALIGIAANIFLGQFPDPLGPAPSVSGLQRVLLAGQAIAFYALNLLRLYPTQFIHPRWNAAWGPFSVVPILLIAALAAVAWSARRRWGRGPILCISIFALLLLPGLVMAFGQFAPAVYAADYRQYLASAVPLAVIAAGCVGLAFHLSSSMSLRAARVLVGIIPIGVLGAFSAVATFTYHDADTGFQAALRHDPSNVVARAQYALMLLDERPTKALQVLDDAGPTGAADVTLLDARARVCLAMGRDEEATSSYLLAERLAPDNGSIPLELGGAYDAAGVAAMADGRENEAFEDYNNALAAYDAARQLKAGNEAVLDGVGRVMLHEGRFSDSIAQFDAALDLNSAFVPARVHKAQAMFSAGMAGDKEQMNLAMPELREALSIDPSNSEAFCAVADMQFRMRNYTAAENGYRSAIRLNPGSAQAWTDLGFAQSAQSRFQEALRSFEHALILQADAPAALRGKHLVQAQLAMGNQKS